MLGLGVIAVLLFMSACFSGTEAALTALSDLKMKRLSAEKPRLKGYFADWLGHPHRLLTSLLVGNNIVNMSLSSLAAVLAVPLTRRWPVHVVETTVWLAATVVILVGGEIVPKIIGRAYRERIAEWGMPAVDGFIRAMAPFWRPVEWVMGRWPHREASPVGRLTAVSMEELLFLIGESQERGQVSADAGDMMKKVLSLSQKTAADILQPASRLETVALESLARIGGEERFADLLIETGHSRVPVTREDIPVGFIHVMDLMGAWRKGTVLALTGLIRRAASVPAAKPVTELLVEFQKTGHHMVFVNGPAGEFKGIITLEDVLEEIVGDILDEYDLEQKENP
jgi:putative hemolysin